MNKFMTAPMAATFMIGFSSTDVDAKMRHKHQNYMWNKGRHYKPQKKHHALRGKHSPVRKRRHVSLPPVVVAHVHIASQAMTVAVNGSRYSNWLVSTAGRGFHTPQGAFHPRDWRAIITHANMKILRCLIQYSFWVATPYMAPTICARWGILHRMAVYACCRSMQQSCLR